MPLPSHFTLIVEDFDGTMGTPTTFAVVAEILLLLSYIGFRVRKGVIRVQQKKPGFNSSTLERKYSSWLMAIYAIFLLIFFVFTAWHSIQ